MGELQSTQGFGPRVSEIPEGDNRERLVCPDCGFINYENPKIVAGAVVLWQGQYLLCRRAIQPRKGYWTIPAGYLELNETVLNGAKREVKEEACADIIVDGLLAVYNIPRISQVQMIYRAELIGGKFAPGVESLETALFGWDDIPWDELAFPSVRWALHHHREVGNEINFQPRTNPEGEWGNY
ncbi:MAG TPA: NUDIX hydrolase [Rhodospirillaceae bacterium]|nr:NUDIX hydrolase [Rhodospirillaceae bacterium]HAA93428.1 NUDIX hydrolase [Rhodospirillaceae bacterium]HAT34527.1 NUDIX hydrolase [Rhodospirillaceae bacterium]